MFLIVESVFSVDAVVSEVEHPHSSFRVVRELGQHLFDVLFLVLLDDSSGNDDFAAVFDDAFVGSEVVSKSFVLHDS
jgi:hypothetical protein